MNICQAINILKSVFKEFGVPVFVRSNPSEKSESNVETNFNTTETDVETTTTNAETTKSIAETAKSDYFLKTNGIKLKKLSQSKIKTTNLSLKFNLDN